MSKIKEYILELYSNKGMFWTGHGSYYTPHKEDAFKFEIDKKPDWYSELFHKLVQL